jgi:hypothetical protein
MRNGMAFTGGSFYDFFQYWIGWKDKPYDRPGTYEFE